MTQVSEQTTLNEPTLPATEAAIAEIWRDLLKRSEVGTNDNFFEIGGNSLAAIKLLQRVEKKFGPDILAPETLYDDPRLGSVAKAVHEAVTAQPAGLPAGK